MGTPIEQVMKLARTKIKSFTRSLNPVLDDTVGLVATVNIGLDDQAKTCGATFNKLSSEAAGLESPAEVVLNIAKLANKARDMSDKTEHTLKEWLDFKLTYQNDTVSPVTLEVIPLDTNQKALVVAAIQKTDPSKTALLDTKYTACGLMAIVKNYYKSLSETFTGITNFNKYLYVETGTSPNTQIDTNAICKDASGNDLLECEACGHLFNIPLANENVIKGQLLGIQTEIQAWDSSLFNC